MQNNTEQLEKIASTMLQSCTEVNSMLRDTINATLQSITIMTQGCSDLCDNLSSLAQKNIEQSVKISQSLMTASSVDELVSTQKTVLQSSMDSMMNDMNNLSQLSSRIAQQAAEPVTKQLNKTMYKMSQQTKAA